MKQTIDQWFVCKNIRCDPIAYPGKRDDPQVYHAGRGVIKKYKMLEGEIRPPRCLICDKPMTPTPEPERT